MVLVIALTGAPSIDVLAAGKGNSNGHGEHRRHGTHVHGVGALNIALDKGEIHIELDSPAANILGFEHAPSSEADHEALERAVAILKEGERLFRFPREARCRLTEANVESSLLGRAEGDRHDDERGHEDSEHSAESEQDHGEKHADIGASWQFDCAHPEELDQLEIGLFQVFPVTERLRVQLITARGQVAAELTASKARLSF